MGPFSGFAQSNPPKDGRAIRFAYVGSRTTKERNARGEGIQVYRVDATNGEWTHVQLLKGLVNPSFLALDLLVDDSNRFVIVANYATGSLAVLPRNADGSLGAVQQLELLPGTPGPHKVDQGFSHPHHLVYDRRRSWIIVPSADSFGNPFPFS